MKALFGLALAASLASGQNVIDLASFGHRSRISPNEYAVPAWHLHGTHKPQILSDRVILTPPYPGNKQGAAWTDSRFSYLEWTAEVDFRASGQEHAGGNLQIWYIKENQQEIGSNSLYTVGKFEGLVLVVDGYGGERGGGIRGFLNDGTIDYKNHHHIEGLAFGHCDFSYRNLGRPSRLQMKQDSTGFEVSIEGRRCFRSDAVLLPSNNYFGITAASSETPDSFEIFKFVTSVPSSSIPQQPLREKIPPQQQQQVPIQDNSRSSSQAIEDALASSISSQEAQFADLHNRIQHHGHAIDIVYSEVQRTAERLQGRVEELHRELAKMEQIRPLESRIAGLENSISALRAEFSKRDYTAQFNEIHNSLKVRHDAILSDLPEKMGHVISARSPRMGFLIFLVVVFQLLLAGAYVMYKRRRAGAPKKYL